MRNRAGTLLLLAGTLAVLLAAVGVVPAGALPAQNENLTIFFTADTQGEIKSCGCPKLDLGGATRRYAFLDTLRGAGWEFVTIDAGGITPFGPMNPQKLLKVEHLARAMARMGLDAVGLGDWDLAQGPDFVARLLEWLGQPVVATNVRFPDSDRFPSVRSRELVVRDRRVALLHFFDPELVTEAHDWLTVEPWEKERSLVEELAARNDVLVAMAAVADSTRLRELGTLFPELTFIVGCHRGADLPTRLVPAGNAMAVGGGTLGKHLGRAEIAFDEEGRPSGVEAIFLPVVREWGRRKAIDEIVADYNRRLQEMLVPLDERTGSAN